MPEDTLEDCLATVKDVLNHNDPFHCECRAYGRLKEVAREDLAGRCYGYLMLDRATERQLAIRGFEDWSRCDILKHPLRCIVKELLPEAIKMPAFTFESLPQMRKDLQDLHAYGVVVWDLHSGNYLDRRIVDFSQAKTVPHFELSWNANLFSRKWAIDCCARDYAGFDGVIAEWNEDHPQQIFWDVFLPNTAFGSRLRNQSRYEEDLANNEGVRLDAIFYDWKQKQPWIAKVGTLPNLSKDRGALTKPFYGITAIKRPVNRVQKRPERPRKRTRKKRKTR